MTEIMDRLTSALADRYRIEGELGQGGMATVYLAQDLRHDRKVALKVLRPELAAVIGAERFLVEIKTTANLQHPHILALFDSGVLGPDASGPHGVYYVMPYVEGESLRDRLKREQQLPVEDAVRIAREVADALEYAHAHGVIHRDIKPENILLHGGHAMVADFGIALAAARSEGGSRMTETGMSLGTPHYMSPEQAMGQREITARSDVYALGCVLYEMLSGEPPFNGPTPQAIVARVMTDEPRALTLQRKSIPPHVESAVMTALEKLPADRFASAKEFAEALDGKRAATGAARTGEPRARPRPHLAWPLALTALLALALVAVVALLRPRAATIPPARFALTLPGEVPPVAVRLSPDGRTIAYAAAGDGDRLAIYVRRLDELTPRKLEGTDDAAVLSFTSDGQWIAFVTASGTAKRVPVAGGGAVPIPVRGGGAVLQIDAVGTDRYVVTLGDRSLAMMEGDGSLKVFATPDTGAGNFVIEVNQILPDGWVLGRYWESPPNGSVIAINPETGERVVLVQQGIAWAGAGDDFLAWALPDGTLFTAPFDLDAKRLTGPAVPVGGTVFAVLGFPPPAAAAGHAMIYVPNRPRILTRVDRSGASTTILSTERPYHNPRVSPDGGTISVDFTEQQRDVWLFNLRDSTFTRFGFDSSAHDATWLPDGSGLLFAASRGSEIGIFRRRFEGPPAAEMVYLKGTQISAHSVTPDGKVAVAVDISRGHFDLFAVPLDGKGKVDTLAGTGFNEGFPALSPDGRWLAYASDESGQWEVYVRGYPGFGQKSQVSQGGGIEPAWSRNGRELFYRGGTGAGPMMVAAQVETGAGFRVAARRELFGVGSYEFSTPHANFDIFPDGRSFVMVRQGRPGQSAELVYLQNVGGLLGGVGR